MIFLNFKWKGKKYNDIYRMIVVYLGIGVFVKNKLLILFEY